MLDGVFNILTKTVKEETKKNLSKFHSNFLEWHQIGKDAWLKVKYDSFEIQKIMQIFWIHYSELKIEVFGLLNVLVLFLPKNTRTLRFLWLKV